MKNRLEDMQEVAIIAKSCTLPCEKKRTEEELEHKRVMGKFSTDGIVMKDER